MNFNFKALLRENALLIDLGETILVALVAFGLPISGDQQSYIVAALIALVGLVKGFTTRPFAAALVTDFGRAALVVLASFGVGLSADQIAVLVTLLGLVTSTVIRGQITPVQDPVLAPAGAGAGPVAGRVRGERGYGSVLGAIGMGLIVLSVILLVTTLLKVFVVSIIVLIVLFVIGLVLLFLDGRGGRF